MPEVLDKAHNLFRKAVQSDGKNVFVRCMYAKFREYDLGFGVWGLGFGERVVRCMYAKFREYY